jgi:hypothetical protein
MKRALIVVAAAVVGLYLGAATAPSGSIAILIGLGSGAVAIFLTNDMER